MMRSQWLNHIVGPGPPCHDRWRSEEEDETREQRFGGRDQRHHYFTRLFAVKKMILPIYIYGQPVLRKVAEDVTPEYPELKICEDL